MLILTRKQNESVIIGDDIKVTVLSDRHGQVKLGIDAGGESNSRHSAREADARLASQEPHSRN